MILLQVVGGGRRTQSMVMTDEDELLEEEEDFEGDGRYSYVLILKTHYYSEGLDRGGHFWGKDKNKCNCFQSIM